jgi:hypothetical protein
MGLPSSTGHAGISGITGGGGGSFELTPAVEKLTEGIQDQADGDQESGPSEETSQPRPRVVSDADSPMTRGGIFTGSDGNLHHVRPMTGPSSGGSTGLFSSQVGAPGDGAP